MCTLVILRRPGHDWPLVLAANRDEMAGRPWRPPGRHWPDRPEVVAGLDELAGGSWLGLNDHGLAAGILNRMGSLGPAAGKRSRGELVLEALDHADAAAAAAALAELDARAWRSFNLIVADNRDAFWIRGLGDAGGPRPAVAEIDEGLGMVTAHDLNDESSARIGLHRPRFATAAPPDPAAGDWTAWEDLLASREGGGNDTEGALNVATESGFGTVSSSLIALPRMGAREDAPVWRFAAGRPGEAPWETVQL